MIYVFCTLAIHWYLSLFCQTFFLHRYAAHSMFTMNKFWERFFFLLTYISQGPSFLNPKAYSILHQRHHQFSDTVNDPHSPHFFKDIFSMMWTTYHKYVAAKNADEAQLEKFVHKYYPRWKKVERLAEFWPMGILWFSFFIFVYVKISPPWYGYLFLPLHLIMGPIQGAVVNWFGHKLGYRNFELQDKSKNTLPVDALLMGELYQNNHHKKPLNANFATKWFEFDVTFVIIQILAFSRVIKLK